MKGLQRKLFRDFSTLRAQVLTIAVLIIGGVSVLVSSWSSYLSLQRSRDSFYREHRFADVFAEVVRAPLTVAHGIAKLPGVEQVDSRVVKDGLVDLRDQTEPALGRFVGIKGDDQELNRIYLRQGRLPEPAGLIVEVVVNEAFAVAHSLRMGDEVKILINGQQRRARISGIGLSPEFVYALSPVAPLPDDKHFGIFWVRQKELEMLTGMDNAFNSLLVKVDERASLDEIKRRMDQILQPYGNIQAYDRRRQISALFVDDEIRQQRVMAVFMPSIFMAVAMFILNIVISRVIALHRGQIATLKSIGYSAWALAWHYFQLVTLILMVGIIPSLFVGAWIGRWYARLYQEFFRFPSIDFSLSWDALALGVFFGLVPGWIGSAGGLIRVFAMHPAEALRPPAPPAFQRGLLEWLGLSRRMNVFSKMVIRSLFFRPLRLGLSILGISAALGILINGSFWIDVLNYMMDRQFFEMRREDLSVRLLNPRDLSVFPELNRIPGVLMSEGERSVPVRLQFHHLKKDIAILGWERGAKLNLLLDRGRRPIEPVPGGVLLSRYFQNSYGLQPGDRVEFTVLEGAERRFSVPVVGFVEDLIGQQAYALKSDLHTWLQEKPVVNIVQLKIDPHLSERIYVDLKQRPEVASVSVRHLLLKSFSDTVAEMVSTFTVILYVFAVAIAGAVIYNSARISFSERSWELASLRILGFGTEKTFELLFLDIGWQVLLSLGPGLALGYGLSYLSTSFIHNDNLQFPLIVEPATYGAAVVVLIVTLVVSGFFLYRRIGRLDFSEALKARE